MMGTLSLAMIVKNEAPTLERVLSCARNFCDEIVVVDTGSTDETVAIAQKHGAKVFHFEWIDDFAAARNFSFQCCTGDWILWLDADDVVPQSEQAKLLALKQSTLDASVDVVCMNYHYRFNEQNHCELHFMRERLFRRSAGLRWQYPLHERIEYQAEQALHRPDIIIEHRPLEQKEAGKPQRNLNILRSAIEKGDVTSRNLYFLAEELRLHHQAYPEAYEHYLKALPLSQIPWERYAILIGLAVCAFAMAEHQRAMDWCLEALVLDSQRAEAFNQLGMHFYEQNQPDKALPFFQAAAALAVPDYGFTVPSDYTVTPLEYIAFCRREMEEPVVAMEKMLSLRAEHACIESVFAFLHETVEQLPE